MIRALLLLSCFLGTLLVSNVVRAAEINVKLCVWTYVDLDDTNPGYEDYGFGQEFYTDAWFWRLRRVDAVVRDYWTGNVVWEADPYQPSWLDSYGCTGDFTVQSGQYLYLDIRPHGGFPNSNLLEIYDGNENLAQYYSGVFSLSNSGDYNILFDIDDDVLRLYAVASQTMLSFIGQMANKTIKVKNGIWHNLPGENRCESSAPRACRRNDVGYITLGSAPTNRRKFILAHEYGHMALCLSGGVCTPRNCTFPDGEDEHTFDEPEYSSCAAMEGWAYFVSADVWNSEGGINPDAWIERGGGALVSAENGEAYYSNGDPYYGYFMQMRNCGWCWLLSQCGRYGTDIDWMRGFWDYHTDKYSSAIGSANTHADLQADVAGASWTYDTAFQGMRDNISARRGATQRDRFIEYVGKRNGCGNNYYTCDDPP